MNEIQGKIKTNMAVFYLRASHSFYRRAKHAEELHENGAFTKNDGDYFNADILGGIISSASLLECYINDLYIMVTDTELYLDSSTERNNTEIIRRMWSKGIPRTARYKILEKYEIFLDLCEKQPLNRGLQPYQDASTLIEIRNELVHFEPEWREVPLPAINTNEELHKWEKKLKGKFEPSKIHKSDHFYFPHYMFSSSCLLWSFNSATALIREFEDKAGISDSPIQFLIEELESTKI